MLEYSLNGTNVLYLPPGDEGWRYDASSNSRGNMNAGRFDIGPEKMVKRGPLLWMGPWSGEITGDRSARLTSKVDPASGVKLTRDFELAADSSHLICTQTIHCVTDMNQSIFAIGVAHSLLAKVSPLCRARRAVDFPKDMSCIPTARI